MTIRLLVIKMASQNERMMELLGRRQEGDEMANPSTAVNGASATAKTTNEVPASPTNAGNTGNTETNSITFGDNANFSSASGIAMGSKNLINQ